MLTFSLIFFALAAVLGLWLAVAIFKKKETRKPVAFAHGGIAATGLVLLVVHALQNPHKLLTVAITLFVIAALGGVLLVANDLRKKPGPVFLVIVHALVAASAVSLVAIVAMK
jgi:hypothetical protein